MAGRQGGEEDLRTLFSLVLKLKLKVAALRPSYPKQKSSEAEKAASALEKAVAAAEAHLRSTAAQACIVCGVVSGRTSVHHAST
jgi:hypothetical protein